MKYEGVSEFYTGRINSALNYSFRTGSDMLDMAQRAIMYDDCLEAEEAVSLLRLVTEVRMKLYSKYWNERPDYYPVEEEA